MSTPTVHQTLQKKIGSLYGDSLPTTIKFQDRLGNTMEKQLPDATLDEIAFSIQLLQTESSAILARRRARSLCSWRRKAFQLPPHRACAFL